MIFLIGLYLLIQLGIGYWVSKKVNNTTDYFLAGRQLSMPLVAISLVATWFGAETCIGSSGAVYTSGLSGSRADPFGYSLCLLLTGLLIAVPMWKGGFITIGDFFSRRFGWFSEKLTVLILVPGSLIWGGAQIRAFGQIISSTTDLPVDITILIATVFIVIYTFQGGLMGDIINDFFQGLIIFTGLTCLLYFTLSSTDFSWSQWWSTTRPERLSFLATDESIWERLDRWAIPILGSLITQELISRTLSAKSPSVAQKACYSACALYCAVGSIPVILGLIGPTLIPNLPDAEKFLPVLAEKYLPPALHVVFIGAIVSALLSTIDSIILSVSALVTQNVLHPFLKNASKRTELTTARLLVIAAAAISYIIAVTSTGIYDLVEMASSFGTAGLLVVTLLGLWTRAGGLWAANLGLFGGAVSYPVAEHLLHWQAPFLVAVVAAFLCFALGWLIEQLPSLFINEVEEALPTKLFSKKMK